MEKLLNEMKMENKYNRTVRKEDLDIIMDYTIKAMKCFTTKYEKKLVSLLILKVKGLIYLHLIVLILKQLILTKNLKN